MLTFLQTFFPSICTKSEGLGKINVFGVSMVTDAGRRVFPTGILFYDESHGSPPVGLRSLEGSLGVF